MPYNILKVLKYEISSMILLLSSMHSRAVLQQHRFPFWRLCGYLH